MSNSSATPSPPTASHPLKGFLKLPAELRLKIYELALIPLPSAKTPCCINKACVPVSEHLASTCTSQPTAVRTIRCCNRCNKHGAGINTALLRVNRQVLYEAAAVLYGNAQILARQEKGIAPRAIMKKAFELPTYALQSIKTFVLVVNVDGKEDEGDNFPTLSRWMHQAFGFSRSALSTIPLPALRTFHIHIDVDLSRASIPLIAGTFSPLHILADKVWFVVDVHIHRAWKAEITGWEELVEERSEAGDFVEELEEVARTVRETFILELREVFRMKGKVLRVEEA